MTLIFRSIFQKQLQEKKDNKQELNLRKILREPLYVQKNELINSLLKDLTLNKKHLAIVKEENKIIGMITMEDILEKIVGTIDDEFEEKISR